MPMQAPMPNQRTIRPGPSFQDFKSTLQPYEQGGAGDAADILGQVSGEIDAHAKRKSDREKLIYERQEALKIQQAKEEWRQAELDFNAAKQVADDQEFTATEARKTREFEREEKRLDRKATADEKNKEEGRRLQENRDDALKAHYERMDAKKKAGKSFKDPFTDYSPFVRANLKRIQAGNKSTPEVVADNEEKIKRLTNDRNAFQEYANKYLNPDSEEFVEGDPRAKELFNRLELIDKEIFNRTDLQNALRQQSRPGGAPAPSKGAGSIEQDYTPTKGKFSSNYVEEGYAWLEANPDDPRAPAILKKLTGMDVEGAQ